MARFKIKRLILLWLASVVGTTCALAEFNHELGLTGGISSYLGDANFNIPFHRPRMAVGGLYRYNIDTRWAIKLSAMYAEVEGDTRDFGYHYPGVDYATFKRGYVDASLSVEFNFFDLGLGKYARGNFKASPYILLGVGLTAYSNMSEAKNMYRFSIPVGIGGKWKINKRWTLGVEWTIHKLFTDDFDVTNSSNKILDNPYKTDKTGFFDTDWYMICNLYITINLFDPQKFCR
ncbi:MAG: outer membrane beta-barrel protein [Paludibacteraceae bacterium]|nr:outer membrane beta-barrel protein [Paludibacteraceae bacterium]